MKVKVTDNRKVPKQLRFIDIEQGEAFLDCNNHLALKVSSTHWYSFYNNMLMKVDDERFQNIPLIVVEAEVTYTDAGELDTEKREQ